MRLFLICISFCFSLSISAQTNYVLVLWDVTHSMNGCMHCGCTEHKDETRIECGCYNKTENIWEETKEGLKNIIQNQNLDGSVKFEIIPFDVNDSGSYEGKVYLSFNQQNKESVLKWVDGFELDKNRIRRTDVCGTLDEAYDKMNSFNAETNYLYLLTDGDQTAKNYSENCLCDKAHQFCNNFCSSSSEGNDQFLILKLKTLETNCDFSECGCIDEVSVKCPGQLGYSLMPIASRYTKTLESNSEVELVIEFKEGLDLEPKGFELSPQVDTREVRILRHSYKNKKMNITLNGASISSGEEVTFRLSFNGSSRDECYNKENITIDDVLVTIINEDVWEIKVPDGAIKSLNK